MKHNVMTKFLLLNLAYTHHAIRFLGICNLPSSNSSDKRPKFNVGLLSDEFCQAINREISEKLSNNRV